MILVTASFPIGSLDLTQLLVWDWYWVRGTGIGTKKSLLFQVLQLHRLLLAPPTADRGMARPESGQLGGAGGQAEGEAGQRDQRGAEGPARDSPQGELSDDNITLV